MCDFPSGEKVIIKFSAKWCGPCKAISPAYNSLAKEFPNIVFHEVDVDEHEEFAQEYNITGMPTFIFLYKSNEINRLTGADKNKLQTFVENLNKV